MKKEYIKPTANIYKVRIHSFLADNSMYKDPDESHETEWGDTKKGNMWGWEDEDGDKD